MKTYSIGRDVNCDIVINDSTDIISRRHALLNVTSSGKMTIVDQSSNGTYVNGIRISQNVPVPVTRKDTISLAHVAKLDWSMVPRSNVYMRYALFGILGILVVVGIIFGISTFLDTRNANHHGDQVSLVDSVELKKIKQAQLDSLAAVARMDSLRQDSLKRISQKRQDSIAGVKKSKPSQRNSESSSKGKKKSPAKPASSKQDIG